MSLSLSLSRLSLGATRGGGIPPVAIFFAADATGTLDTATPPAGYSLPGTDQTVTLSASGYDDVQVDVAASGDGTVTENVASDISTTYASLPVGSTASASGAITLIRDSDTATVTGTLVASIAGVLDIELEADLSQIEASSQTLAEGSTVTLSAPGMPSTNYTITGGNAEFVADSTGVGYLNLPDGVGLQRDLTDTFSVFEFGAFVHAKVASDASVVEVANVTSRSGTGTLIVERQTDGTLDATLTDDSGTSASVTGASYPAGERRTIGVNVGDGDLFLASYDGSSYSPASRTASVAGLSAFNIDVVTLFQGGDVTAYGLMVAAPADLTAAEVETNISDLHDTYSYSPASFFASGEVGDVWNPYDSGTTWQDTSATTAAGLGDDVARIDGLAGNHNLLQATPGRRPTLGASTRNLELDGVDDGMYLSSISLASKVATFAITLEGGLSKTTAAQVLSELSDVAGSTNGAFITSVRPSSESEEIGGGVHDSGFRAEKISGVLSSQPVTLFVEYDNSTISGKIRFWANTTELSTVVNAAAKSGTNDFAASQTFNLGARAASGTIDLPAAFSSGPSMLINRALTAQERSDYVDWVAGL